MKLRLRRKPRQDPVVPDKELVDTLNDWRGPLDTKGGGEGEKKENNGVALALALHGN
jgi:hypothetical protein